MTDWKDFYGKFPLNFEETDYLRQVGHTIDGEPISDQHFHQLIQYISELLDIKKSDTLLDLGCGNGIITKALAQKCKAVLGVDFSEPLIKVAQQHHAGNNIQYRHMDILVCDQTTIKNCKFSKVLMFGALQHFEKSQLVTILKNLQAMSTPTQTILFGWVPDRKYKWSYYNTTKKKFRHLSRVLLNKELMGTWWDENYIAGVCKELGLEYSFHKMNSGINTGNYRFEIKVQTR